MAAIVDRLADATADESHAFWPDDVTLLDRSIVDPTRIHGPRQLTDVYLLALAVAHASRFFSFDGSIATDIRSGDEPSRLKIG